MQPGDIVQLDRRVLDAPERARLWRYHKPAGLVTTHRDPEGRPTVFEKLPEQLPRVISVGRLDLTSEGLLLLTNDGGAGAAARAAGAWLDPALPRAGLWHGGRAALAALARGVTVEGVRYGPIEAGLDSRKGENAWLTVSLREGRNREIRRVMQHLGLHVTRLIRVAHGPFQLGQLPRGAVEEVPAKVLREQLPKADAKRPRREDHRRHLARQAAGRAAGRRHPPHRRPGAAGDVRHAAARALGRPRPARGRARARRLCRHRRASGWRRCRAARRMRASSSATARRSPRCAPTSPPAGPRTAPPCSPPTRCARRPGAPAALAFLDPPYAEGAVPHAVAALAAAGWLAPGDRLLIAEIRARAQPARRCCRPSAWPRAAMAPRSVTVWRLR